VALAVEKLDNRSFPPSSPAIWQLAPPPRSGHLTAPVLQGLAGGGQLRTVTRSLEQRDADLALENRDLLAHGGLREVERIGGRGKRSPRDHLT
jgi:hypothetical protein